MATTITYTVNSVPAVDTVVSVTDSLTGINLSEIFKVERLNFGESSLSETGLPPSNFSVAFFLKKFLSIDYNNTSLYNIVFSGNTVTVTALNTLSQFTLDSNTTAGAVSIVINNDVPIGLFTIDAVTVSEATIGTPCNDVKFSATLSEQADTINSPISQGVGTNPFIFETIRADSILLEFQKGIDIASQEFRIPKLLSIYFEIDIVNTPGDSTITVNRLTPLTDVGTGTFPLTFEYSLDDVIFQNSNSWSGLPPDNYTMFVRDNIGCKINFPFTIDVFTPNLVDFDAVAEISNLNPISFIEVVAWDDCGIRKSPDNALSFEERDIKPKQNFAQIFQKCDSPMTQIKTNYDTRVAVLIDSLGAETPITITKKTANMNITDIRDVHTTNINTSTYIDRLGVYYGAGNTYDPITVIQNGTYNLGTSLPTWINIGDYIFLEGLGWVLVEDIITFNGFKTIVTNTVFSTSIFSQDEIVKGTSVYNQVDFERYEFTNVLAALEGCFKIKVNLTDATFPAIEFMSEWLNIQTSHPNHYLIDYYSTVNNKINFSFGFRGRVRIPYEQTLKWKPNVEEVVYVSNEKTTKLENQTRNFYDFFARAIPTKMAQKLVLILGTDRLQIDSVNYLLEGEPERESLESTNLYEVTATVVEADFVFNSNSGIASGEIILPTGTPLAIDENASGLLFVD